MVVEGHAETVAGAEVAAACTDAESCVADACAVSAKAVAVGSVDTDVAAGASMDAVAFAGAFGSG